MTERAILSEKSEDNKSAAEWGIRQAEFVLFPGAAFGCDCPLPVSVCVLVSASADSPGGIGSLAVCRAEIFLERAAFPGSRLWGSVGGSGFSLAE